MTVNVVVNPFCPQPISKSFGRENFDTQSAYQPKHNCPIVSFNWCLAQSPGRETQENECVRCRETYSTRCNQRGNLSLILVRKLVLDVGGHLGD